MQTVTGSSARHGLESEVPARRASRAIAIVSAGMALGFGIAGLLSLSPETWGIGLIVFGCLLAIISLLAQAAEHFARASARNKQHSER
jgi:hypothetical protein